MDSHLSSKWFFRLRGGGSGRSRSPRSHSAYGRCPHQRVAFRWRQSFSVERIPTRVPRADILARSDLAAADTGAGTRIIRESFYELRLTYISY